MDGTPMFAGEQRWHMDANGGRASGHRWYIDPHGLPAPRANRTERWTRRPRRRA